MYKNQFSVHWRIGNGKGVFKEYPMTAKGISEFKKNLSKDTEVGLEATGNSKYFYDSIANEVSKVRVINPLQFKIISKAI